MVCLHCGKDIDETIFPPPLAYCPYCGQPLESSSTGAAEPSVPFCPHCGKELPGKVSFCPYCGGEVARRAAIPYVGPEGIEPTEHGAKPIIVEPPEVKKKTEKLYKEWMKYANLPPEAAPLKEVPREVPAGRAKNSQRLLVLYLLLVICIVIVGVGVVLLIMRPW